MMRLENIKNENINIYGEENFVLMKMIKININYIIK